MKRRAFLGCLAALAGGALIVEPTLEEIERLTWRRRLFPGWSAAPADSFRFTIAGVNSIETGELAQFLAVKSLEILERQLVYSHAVSREYDRVYATTPEAATVLEHMRLEVTQAQGRVAAADVGITRRL